jgi:hypothetical protein
LAGLATLSLTPWIAAKAEVDGKTKVPYAQIGGWAVTYHPYYNECSIWQRFSRGTGFWMGYEIQDRAFKMMMGNPNWRGRVTPQGSAGLTMVMDGERWNGTGEWIATDDGEPVLVLRGLKPQFVASFMKRWQVEVYNSRGEWVTTLPLNNSWAAMEKMWECQSTALNNGQQQPRPAPQRPSRPSEMEV